VERSGVHVDPEVLHVDAELIDRARERDHRGELRIGRLHVVGELEARALVAGEDRPADLGDTVLDHHALRQPAERGLDVAVLRGAIAGGGRAGPRSADRFAITAFCCTRATRVRDHPLQRRRHRSRRSRSRRSADRSSV
jgi:hypothetical protein